MRRPARAMIRTVGLFLLLLGAACQTSGGVGLDFTAGAPQWGPFSGGKMFGAPL